MKHNLKINQKHRRAVPQLECGIVDTLRELPQTI